MSVKRDEPAYSIPPTCLPVLSSALVPLPAARSPCPWTLPTMENHRTCTSLPLVLKETKFRSKDLQLTVATCSPQVADRHLSAPHVSVRRCMTVSSTPSGCAKGTRRQLHMLTQHNTESPPLAGTTNPHLGAPIRHLLSTPILVGGQHPSSPGPEVLLLTTGIRNPPGVPDFHPHSPLSAPHPAPSQPSQTHGDRHAA